MSKRVKSLITTELEKKFKGAESIGVIDYIGIDSKTPGAIRSDLRKKKVKMTVVRNARSEEHTSELQSRFGISYAVFCVTEKRTMSMFVDNCIPNFAKRGGRSRMHS